MRREEKRISVIVKIAFAIVDSSCRNRFREMEREGWRRRNSQRSFFVKRKSSRRVKLGNGQAATFKPRETDRQEKMEFVRPRMWSVLG